MDVNDPTLYRVFSFLITPARARHQTLVPQIKRVNATLAFFAHRAGIPQPARTPEPQTLAWHEVSLWDSTWVKSAKGEINLHGYAQTRHADGVMLLGVEQDGTSELDNWLRKATRLWGREYGKEDDWRGLIAFPQEEVTGGRLRLTGQTWLHTAEWDQAPREGWEAFAQQRYNQGAYWLFSWGVMGYTPSGEDSLLPQFELHVESKQSAQRDSLLYGALLPLLIDFLKISQFVWLRYKNYTYPSLSKEEQGLISWIERASQEPLTLTLQTTEDNVRLSIRLLHGYSRKILELTEDIHTVATDYAAVKEIWPTINISMPDASQDRFILGEMKRIENQMASDLEYFKISGTQADRTVKVLQILVDIERARGENRLVTIGIILASFIGLGALLPEKIIESYSHTGNITIRFVLSAGLGCLVVGVYYAWHRWRAKENRLDKKA